MRYHKPFDLVQRQDAIARYRQMRGNAKLLASQFSPRDRAERTSLRTYRRAVRMFGEALIRPDSEVDVNTLNDFGDRAVRSFTEYFQLRMESDV